MDIINKVKRKLVDWLWDWWILRPKRKHFRVFLKRLMKNCSYPELTGDQLRDLKKAGWGRYASNKSFFRILNARGGSREARLEDYIPDDFHFEFVDPFFNHQIFSSVIDDKNWYELFLPEIKHPKAVIRRSGGVYMDDK